MSQFGQNYVRNNPRKAFAMDIYEAIKNRHSVRSYTSEPLSDSDIDVLVEEIAYANYKGNLDLQLLVDEPSTFVGGFASYGQIKGAANYIALVGPKGKTLDLRFGYYGEQIVLKATMLGLDTCWLGLTYNKSKMPARVDKGSACRGIIVVGHGTTHGQPHKVKPIENLCLVGGEKTEKISDLPDWFTSGLEAASLAPTALNQQKFVFDLVDGRNSRRVRATTKRGPYTQMDLGIARRHFEIGANSRSKDWIWA